MLPLLGSAYNSAGRNIIVDDSLSALTVKQTGGGHILDLIGPTQTVATVFETSIAIFSTTFINNTPFASPNYGLFNVGPGPWDGTSAGHYVGSGQGGGFVANFAAGYTGDHIRTQVQGVDYFRISSDGSLLLGTPGGNGVNNISAVNSLLVNGTQLLANPTSWVFGVRGRDSQSGDLFQAQASTSAVLCGIRADGLLYATTVGLATKVTAGAPVDADWATAPPDGTVVADLTNIKLWVRIGGQWKGVTVA